MNRPFTMYHKVIAPEGRRFDADNPYHPSREELAREGWVSTVEEMTHQGEVPDEPDHPFYS